ncbi:C-glycoside deglycosidase beta subunit domain-containing protein [Microbacterium hydrothermale]|uniref:C-glycoside deglycosidase beta subunit domain-containing protein n=1 Tax=Microbacterium hydrothermale TaxID=857427 RepID=UPI0010A7C866|nr:DUF6379 domain-containing protein [Microbacterium hydrothermale]
MFDRYLLEDDTFANVEVDGEVVGWKIGARIGYYRGLGLSMIELSLAVDGSPVPPESIRLQLHGADYRLSEIEDVLDDRWGFSETVILFVDQPGGLAPGEHEIAFEQSLRISYLAVPSVNRVSRRLALA